MRVARAVVETVEVPAFTLPAVAEAGLPNVPPTSIMLEHLSLLGPMVDRAGGGGGERKDWLVHSERPAATISSVDEMPNEASHLTVRYAARR